MTNITKSKITINSIIEFVHKAMAFNLPVYNRANEIEAEFGFDIDKGDSAITIVIYKNNIEIFTQDNGYVLVENSLTDRDELDLKTLEIDIKEYNEDKALNILNNFFTIVEDKPTSVDDLNDDDE